jgi:hypothetical protein
VSYRVVDAKDADKPTCVARIPEAERQATKVIVENLSGDVFSKLNLYFRVRGEQAQIYSVSWSDDPPARTNAIPSDDCTADKTRAGHVSLAEFQPGWRGVATIWTSAGAELTIHHQTETGEDPKALRLVEDGLMTWLVRHEFYVFISLALFLLVVAGAYLWTIRKRA